MAGNESNVIEFTTNSSLETKAIGQAIGEKCRGGEVVLLSGPLGAGKTTLVQGLAKGLGISGPVQSPSFVLEKIHRGRLLLRHLDLYRLSASEVDDAGFLSEIHEGDVTVIEWAERAGETIDATLRIDIEVHSAGPSKRTIRVESLSPGWKSYLNGVRYREPNA